jgi:hypothetical protein
MLMSVVDVPARIESEISNKPPIQLNCAEAEESEKEKKKKKRKKLK